MVKQDNQVTILSVPKIVPIASLTDNVNNAIALTYDTEYYKHYRKGNTESILDWDICVIGIDYLCGGMDLYWVDVCCMLWTIFV